MLGWPLQAVGVDNVAGTKGDFRVEVTGGTIKIEYDPKNPPNTCKKIVFVQTCLTKIDGTAVKPSEEDEDWKFQDDDTAKDGKTTIDHVTCEADPYYNGDDTDKDIGEQGDATKAEADDDATMDDTPGTTVPAGKDTIVYEYETCAYCADDNTFIECVTWKYTNDKTAGESVDHNTGANAKAPSDAIKEAKKAFVDNHTKDGSTFSQEATTAADGKKFDIQGVSPAFNLFSDETHSPGNYEPGSNLMEFLQNGVFETDVTLPIDIIPRGSVRGVEVVNGRELLTVVVELADPSLGSPLLFEQPFQMQIGGFDPGTSSPIDLVDAQLLAGAGGVGMGPFLADFNDAEPESRYAADARLRRRACTRSAAAPRAAAAAGRADRDQRRLRRRPAPLDIDSEEGDWMTTRRRENRARLGLIVALCSLAISTAASAQIALFSQIVEPLPADYDQHLVKLTYMGPQKKNVASLGLHTSARVFDYAPFVPFYQPGLRYANDGVADRTAEVTTGEIDSFVTRMQMFPLLTDNTFMPGPFLSVSITKPDGLGGHIVWEGLYTEEEAKVVLGTLENRLLGNPAAKASVHSFKINCLKL